MSAPPWQLAEQLVAKLEQAIAPYAKVEHNVLLPVVGRKRWRQCDVVIRYGTYPRESIAIVEVQKRKRRPTINAFHGWLRKKDQVGAQHLICVSEAGFPTSIIEEVRDVIGPSVRLLNLSDTDFTSLLDLGLPPLRARKRDFTAHPYFVGPISASIPKEGVFRSTGSHISSSQDRLFAKSPDNPLTSLNELIAAYYRERYIFVEGEFELDLALEFPSLYMYVENTWCRVTSLPVRGALEVVERALELKISAYRQLIDDVTVAWLATATGEAAKGPITFEITFIPAEDGYLRYSCVTQTEGDSIDLELHRSDGVVEVFRL
jgi:hypothetical protein